MATAYIRGGVCYAHKLSATGNNLVMEYCSFKKKDYITKASVRKDLFTLLPDGRVVVPRYFPFMYSHLFEKFSNVGSLGYPLPSGSIKVTLGHGGIDQEGFVSSVVRTTQENQLGGYAIADCGTGKTLMGLEIARRLGLSTLIIVPIKFVAQQWISELADKFSFPPMKLVTTKNYMRVNGQTSPFCVGLIPSMQAIQCSDFFKSFGLILIDEAHHLPADTCIALMQNIKSKFIIALSAKLRRTDGLESMFQVMLGKPLAFLKAKKMQAKVKYLEHGIPTNGLRYCKSRISMAKKFSNNLNRNMFILYVCKQVMPQNRQILLFTELVEHGTWLMSQLIAYFGANKIGRVLPNMAHEVGISEGKKQLTIITYRMGTEAINFPHKDTIICASPPYSDVNQLYGRISRYVPDKKEPVIYELFETQYPVNNMQTARIRAWKDHGIIVSKYNMKQC